MGKLWGYDYSPRYETKSRPGGMFAKQTVNGARITMKLPHVYDIQRKVLARHLMYISQRDVYRAKVSDLQFEEKAKAFKEKPLGYRILRSRRQSMSSFRELAERDETDSCETEQFRLYENFTVTELESIGKFKYLKGKKKPAAVSDIRLTEDWQMRNWAKVIYRDINSVMFNEVYTTRRICAHDNNSTEASHAIIYMEAAWEGLKKHDGPLMCQALLGLFQEYRRMSKGTRPKAFDTFLWNIGFLLIINHYKDDLNMLKQFIHAKTIFNGFPTFFNVQTATWFIQKGFVRDGLSLLEENYPNKQTARYYRTTFMKNENPKRQMILFVVGLIRAAHQYCLWRKQSVLCEDGYELTMLDEDTMRRDGESALAIFENAHNLCKDVNADVMSFLEPYVELLLEYRSANRAKDIVQESFDENDGNKYVEQFYVHFMQKHLAHEYSRDDLSKMKQRFESKFDLVDEHKSIQKRGRAKINRLRENNKQGNLVRLQQLHLPGFSI